MKSTLTEELVDSSADRAYKQYEHFGGLYRAGMIGSAEFFDKMLAAFSEGFWMTLRNNKLELDINDSSCAVFLADYEAYRRGCEIKDSEGKAWLYCAQGQRQAALPEDRSLFFKLMERFELTPEFFAPVPDFIPCPRARETHSWNDCAACRIDFGCTDDGGLLKCPSPLGKTFTLTGEHGLRAVLTVKEDRRGTDRSGLDFDELVSESAAGTLVLKAEFLAEGSIEGYTASVRTGIPNVLIRTRGGKVDSLSYYRSAEDYAAMREFPLWREFYKASAEIDAARQRTYNRLFDRYKESPEEDAQ